MAGRTLEELQAELQQYEAARDRILTGQSYSIGEMTLRRPDLKWIEERIKELRFQIARYQGLSHAYPLFGGKR